MEEETAAVEEEAADAAEIAAVTVEETVADAAAEAATVEDTVAADAAADMAVEAAADSAAHAKCTKSPAPSAERRPKCRSSQQKEGLCTAGIASRSTESSRFFFYTDCRAGNRALHFSKKMSGSIALAEAGKKRFENQLSGLREPMI